MGVRVLLLMACMSWYGMGLAARLESLVVDEGRDRSTIYCTFSGTPQHRFFLLNQPHRAVIDLLQTTTSLNVSRIGLKRDFITRVRSGHPNLSTLRLVFDVRDRAWMKVMPWQPLHQDKRGLRIELNHEPIKPSLMSLKTTAVHSPSPSSTTRPVRAITRVFPHRLRDVVVVLDPGHGGKDPGATGPRHSLEKHVVLAMALKLKQRIDRQPGMRAVLTRNGDYYIGLRERMNIARRYNADIFIALHADAFIHQDSNGASVFALSPRGATSEAARWLAEKENHSELGGVNLSELDDQNGVIRTVLLDLSQTATIEASLQMGKRVLQDLGTVTTLHNRRVEQARFMVLKSPDIPSILIETGFISNPREERNLTSSAYQMRLTQAIFQGIKRYFADYPPHGSRLEAMNHSR